MRSLRPQSGFTLLELVLVLAISSMFAASILVVQGDLRSHTAFSDAVNQAESQLTGIQNEANANVSARQSGAAGESDGVVFGKMVTFDSSTTAAKQQMTEYTLVGSATDPTTELQMCDPITLPFQQGVEYRGTGSSTGQQAIVFANDDSGGTGGLYALQNYPGPNLGSNSLCSSSSVVTNDRSYSCPSGQTWDSVAMACTTSIGGGPVGGGPVAAVPTITAPATGTTTSSKTIDVTVSGQAGNCFYLTATLSRHHHSARSTTGPLCDNVAGSVAGDAANDGKVIFAFTFPSGYATYSLTATQADCSFGSCSAPGPQSAASAAVSVQYVQLPQPTITAPATNTWYRGSSTANFTIQGQPGDTAQLYVNGSLVGASPIGSNGTVQLKAVQMPVPTTSGTCDGIFWEAGINWEDYTIYAQEVDSQGNESAPSESMLGVTYVIVSVEGPLQCTVTDWLYFANDPSSPTSVRTAVPSYQQPSLLSRLIRPLVGTAYAAGGSADPLNPASYAPGGAFSANMSINLDVNGDPNKTATIQVNPGTNTLNLTNVVNR